MTVTASGKVWVVHKRIRNAETIDSVRASKNGAEKALDEIEQTVNGMRGQGETIWDMTVPGTRLDQDFNGGWYVEYDLHE